MTKLNLNFLNNPHQVDQPNLISLLEIFGKEISEYAKDYFSYIVTSSINEGVLTGFSLYIIAPEIGYDYKVINVEILSVKDLRITFFTLISKQTEIIDIDISEGTKEYVEILSKLLSNSLFNSSLQFIVDQILLKRSDNCDDITVSEIRNHISSNVTVRKDLILYGIISGDVTLVSPSILTIYGMVNGNVEVLEGTSLILHGMINGNVVNYGYCEINGTINGNLIDMEGGIKNVTGIIKPK
jgi:cytoskeletal protein CcmA (bactofilin family)